MRPPWRTKAAEPPAAWIGRMAISPNRPPKTARSPAALPGTGITRTAVVLWLMTPMATSSAIRAGEGLGVGVAGDGDHVEADRADGRHRLELGEGQVAVSTASRQRGVLAHGDERAGEAADGRGGEAAPLLHRVVQQRERGRRAGGADLRRRPSPGGSRRRCRPPAASGPARGRRSRRPRRAARRPRGRSTRPRG